VVGLHDLILRAIEIPGGTPPADRQSDAAMLAV
jgi:hypothetical protein